MGEKAIRGGRCGRGRRKRQNSEGDSLVWKEEDLPRVLRRRGSEGSEIYARKGGVLAQLLERVRPQDRRGKDRRAPTRECESDVDEGRSSSRERAAKSRRRAAEKADAAERVIDRAAASFDASAVPERPKSACESTLLRAAEKLYSAAAAARPIAYQERRSAERLPDSKGARSRDSSGGRTRSAEREREAGIRTPKSVPPPRIPGGQRGELSLAEVRAIVHAEANGSRSVRQDGSFGSATVPRKACPRKENIYENVPFPLESRTLQRDLRPRSFKKQSSLDTIPSELRSKSTGSSGSSGIHRKNEAAVVAAVTAAVTGEGRRGPPLRKADSFEGHEEAVRTLVAAVHENRILRRKKTK